MQDVAADRGNCKAKLTGLTEKTDRQKIVLQLFAGFVLACRAATNVNTDVVSCTVVYKMHVAWLLVCLSLWNGEHSNSL